jgi:hypothetical protein
MSLLEYLVAPMTWPFWALGIGAAAWGAVAAFKERDLWLPRRTPKEPIETSRRTPFWRIKRGRAAEERYKATLAAAAQASDTELRRISDEELNSLGVAVSWAVNVKKAYNVPEVSRLQFFLIYEEKRRREAREEIEKRSVLGLTTAPKSDGKRQDLLLALKRSQTTGTDFFSSSTLDVEEQKSLRDTARTATQSPATDLTALDDSEILKAGIALELEIRHQASKGERSLSMAAEYHRYEQEWRRRHLDEVPTDSLLVARGIGEIEQLHAYRNRIRAEDERDAWDADFNELVKTRRKKK